MSKPIFLCIPGASHPVIIYEPLKASLSLHGYSAVLLQLPSTGGNPPTFDFTEDLAAIRNTVAHLSDSGNDVIVVAHGWSGVMAGEALQGLGKVEREQRGRRGGVLRLVFIMGWVVKEGFQGARRGDVSSMFSYLRPDLQTNTATPVPDLTTTTLFSDMAPQQANFWTSQLLPQSLGVFWSRTTYAAWRHIPSTYVLCGSDRNVSPDYAEVMVQEARDCGMGELSFHFSFLSRF
ncbi:hypothetical protein HYALB_00007005 [Hymenoscyphus albidus]|uniref:AB hydrolase-1 domain-containing protein n=1 Tax=Hymenoscyphus albidus TaxID=595503 RepID=A0A9N9LL47_9HELO|nr:hypothetical protein HYALB_00007005 [Hymenoscyphus albidus]